MPSKDVSSDSDSDSGPDQVRNVRPSQDGVGSSSKRSKPTHRQVIPVLPTPREVTPVNGDRLRTVAADFPDQDILDYVIDGLNSGFSLGCHPGSLKSIVRHSPSATNHPEVVRGFLLEESAIGSMAGPFASPPVENLHLNRVSLKKKHESIDTSKPLTDQYRIIVDLSAPSSHSVNDFIGDCDASVKFVSLDTVFDKIVSLGKGTWLSKFDISRAYRIIPVAEADRRFLGVKLENEFFIDLTLSLGGRSAAKIFNTFGDVVAFAVEQGCSATTFNHYLDDFLGCSPPTQHDRAQADFEAVQNLLQWLGIPLAAKKLIGPTTSLPFLGFQIDTCAMTVSLTDEKRLRYLLEVDKATRFKKIQFREFSSLEGKLQHVCGRPILRCIIDSAKGVREKHHFVTWSPGAHEDLVWWAKTLSQWCGTRLLTFRTWRCEADICASSDASGAIGFGLVCGREWSYGFWSDRDKTLDICVLELLPIVFAAVLWGHCWQRKRVLFYCDNWAIVQSTSSGLPRDALLATLLRRVATEGIQHDFDLKVVHLPGKENIDADALSRGNLAAFRARNPSAHSAPLPVPAALREELRQELGL